MVAGEKRSADLHGSNRLVVLFGQGHLTEVHEAADSAFQEIPLRRGDLDTKGSASGAVVDDEQAIWRANRSGMWVPEILAHQFRKF